MDLSLVPRKKSQFTIQKFHTSNDNLKILKLCPGNFVIAKLSSNAEYVCKIFPQNNLHPKFCYMDDSVMINRPVRVINKCIKVNEIVPINQPKPINKIIVDVVCDSIEKSLEWKENKIQLNDVLRKYILKYFIITSNSTISLNNLPHPQRFGINLVIVLNSNVDSSVSEVATVGRIVGKTKLVINKIICSLQYDQKEQTQNVKLGGLQNVTKDICDIINLHKVNKKADLKFRPCRQILLVGPPGCGKTSLVHTVASITESPLIAIKGPELSRQNPGETENELRDIFHKATLLTDHGKEMCILLLDELDSICVKRGASTGSHINRITTQLLLLLDQADKTPGLVVIATTNQPDLLHPGVRRPGRMENEIFIKVPSESDREDILNVLTESVITDKLQKSEVHKLCSELAKITPGYTGADLSLICQNVVLNIHRKKEFPSTYTEWFTVFKLCVQNSQPSSLKSSAMSVSDISRLTLNDIGGSDDIKKTLRVAVEWPLRHPEVFKRMGLPQPKGVLLYGPPGCAKTSLACAIAAETHCSFLSISAAQLYSPYVGVAEKTISELFHRARQSAPSVVFIDEIDALVGSRAEGKGTSNEVQERILATLLAEMDGVGIKIGQGVALSGEKLLENGNHVESLVSEKESKKVLNVGVIVIAATNRPDKLDSALIRPGRFDRLVYVPPPNAGARANILKVLTLKIPLDSDVCLEDIAEQTEMCSGADLKNLCKEAALEALTTDGMDVAMVNAKHFNAAIRKTKPSLTKTQIEWFEHFRSNSAS